MRTIIRRLLSLLIVAAWTTVISAQTDIPRILSYQGQLATAGGGQVFDGDYPVTVTIYTDEDATQPLWSDSYRAAVKNGIFTVLLGSGSVALPKSTELDKQLWIGTKIGTSPELRPLTLLSPAAYALNVADRSVTREKMATDYVGVIKLDGQPITEKGSTLNFKSGPGMLLNFDKVTGSLTLSSPWLGTGLDGKPQWIGNNPCGTNNDGGVLNATITGGCGNVTVNGGGVGAIFASIIGGLNNTADADYSTVAGGTGNWASACAAFVGGGGTDCMGNFAGNTASGIASALVGGYGNTASGNNSALGGGTGNTSGGAESFVGSGNGNNASAAQSAVVGGGGNTASGANSMVGGGSGNTASAIETYVGGGNGNTASAAQATVGGGLTNSSTAIATTVGGGEHNQATSDWAVVGGGKDNTAGGTGITQTVAGGEDNTASGDGAAITGGEHNSALAMHSSIIGGIQNTITAGSAHGTIGGGMGNNIGNALGNPQWGTIGGGFNNLIQVNNYGVIGGGKDNIVGGAGGVVMTIGGGEGNHVWDDGGTIAGGEYNTVNLIHGFIGGGINNTTNGHASVVSGGLNNQALVAQAAVGGGQNNLANAANSTIAGGSGNTAAAATAAVGGGNMNAANGISSAIPGGDNLTAQMDGQTVVGTYNIPVGAFTFTAGIPPGPVNNDPLFVVGNGVAGTPSNAFYASVNGHAMATQILGNYAGPGNNPPEVGGYYNDNVINAWGDVVLNPGPPAFWQVANDFGVVGVAFAAPNVFTITLNYTPAAGALGALANASITATVTDDFCGGAPGAPGYCTVTHLGACGALGANVFQVRTYVTTMTGGPGVPCTIRAGALPFMFKVAGR